MSELIQDSLPPPAKSLWLTRLAWVISIVFNPFLMIGFLTGISGDSFFDTLKGILITAAVYKLPCAQLLLWLERYAQISHWSMPERVDKLRGLLVCGLWCFFCMLVASVIIMITREGDFEVIWFPGFFLWVSILIAYLAIYLIPQNPTAGGKRPPYPNLHIMGALVSWLIFSFFVFLTFFFNRVEPVAPKLKEYIAQTYIFYGFAIGSVFWAQRYLGQTWRGILKGIYLALLFVPTSLFFGFLALMLHAFLMKTIFH
jgi:hypothetical protein